MAEVFKANIEGQEVEFKVNRPTGSQQRESEKVYRRVFREAVENKDFVRARLDDKLREQGLWDDNKQVEHDTIIKEIAEGRKKLLKKGIKLSEAKKIALDVIDQRNKLLTLLMARNQLDGLTAEAQAENAKFNYLVSVCTVYNTTNKPYFSGLDDYIEKGSTDVAIKAATALMKLIMDIDSGEEEKSVENRFLKEWKFVNDKGQLINKEGHLVDREGRLINEDGHFVNEKGERVDINGDPVNENGDWKFEDQPFLDDEGQPLVPPSTVEEVKEQTDKVG
jgi:hypothetical protein